RFGDNADLAAGPGAELGRKIAGINAEFLHVFEARLQTERRSDLAVKVTRRGADDSGTLDTVVTNGILLVGTSIEAEVNKGTAAGVLGSWGLQGKLRKLPAVKRQVLNLTLIYVGTHSCRRGV